MKFIAQELREYMAKLGVATVDELVGRTDLLKPNAKAAEKHVDLSRILGYKYDQHRRWITTTRMYMISNWSRQQI